MSLVFADDFSGPSLHLQHRPQGHLLRPQAAERLQDFSTLTFTGHDSPKNPFAQVDSYLRIRASEKTHSSGLISSLKNDASGIKVATPLLFRMPVHRPERHRDVAGLLAHDGLHDRLQVKATRRPCDELDIIEAYGGEGPHEPNAGDSYMITPHCWNQGEAGKAIEKKAFDGMHNPVHMRKFGIPSTWFETFHTYGCKLTETDTIYYCDHIEVGRHATLPVCRSVRSSS